ncbi:MAG: hypothetical protein M1549_01685 [Candidatus Dependentiae bacterium]|nr:hypothetical protein [Candidatus Dependentiae bacterium]
MRRWNLTVGVVLCGILLAQDLVGVQGANPPPGGLALPWDWAEQRINFLKKLKNEKAQACQQLISKAAEIETELSKSEPNKDQITELLSAMKGTKMGNWFSGVTQNELSKLWELVEKEHTIAPQLKLGFGNFGKLEVQSMQIYGTRLVKAMREALGAVAPSCGQDMWLAEPISPVQIDWEIGKLETYSSFFTSEVDRFGKCDPNGGIGFASCTTSGYIGLGISDTGISSLLAWYGGLSGRGKTRVSQGMQKGAEFYAAQKNFRDECRSIAMKVVGDSLAKAGEKADAKSIVSKIRDALKGKAEPIEKAIRAKDKAKKDEQARLREEGKKKRKVQEQLEKEEKERKEREKREKEKLEEAKKKQEQEAKEKQERESREKLAAEQREKARVEAERLAKLREEEEEKRMLEKKLEQQRLKKEKLRQEQEAAERAKLAKERLEKERAEKKKLAQQSLPTTLPGWRDFMLLCSHDLLNLKDGFCQLLQRKSDVAQSLKKAQMAWERRFKHLNAAIKELITLMKKVEGTLSGSNDRLIKRAQGTMAWSAKLIFVRGSSCPGYS